MNDHVETLASLKATIIDLAIRFGPKVFVAIAIIVVGYIVGRQVGRVMARGLRKFELEPPVRELLVRIAHLTPAIGISVLADSSINISVRPWISVADFGLAGGDINKAIVETFRGNNIVIPFPQREIRMLA